MDVDQLVDAVGAGVAREHGAPAGFGDVGFCGYWTLEMFAVQPIRIYPGVPICQIFYHDVRGDVTEYKSEKYQNNQDIQPSMMFKEWQNKNDPQKRLFGQETAR